eukprot:CAMPEP_0180291530 /NCGR_PEP_ID=MMETSP0988-20121125/16182_1 /TAXON_ID=697907 /ORGANISM="non described non described, Strain CCMP2293" /LENGTH=47 /DNA_ID= /DNA_START= /DNA_END= /DNA_ORIENTATION=
MQAGLRHGQAPPQGFREYPSSCEAVKIDRQDVLARQVLGPYVRAYEP